jgi:phosphoribosylformimino-5-aminoimidazole carboxamide ribotide isomerase
MLATLAVEQPDVLEGLIAGWGAERIGASLDARDGLVRVRGWQQGSGLSALEAALRLRDLGLEWLAFTDIGRDGLQTGLNLPATQELSRQTGMKVIASGGVRGAEDVRAAREAGLAGVIVGRALYEGAVKLEEVI